jgi:cell division protease FtsH
MAHAKNYSEATAVEIDGEIRGIVDTTYRTVKHLLADNIELLHRLSLDLVEKETLSGTEVDQIVAEFHSAAVGA